MQKLINPREWLINKVEAKVSLTDPQKDSISNYVCNINFHLLHTQARNRCASIIQRLVEGGLEINQRNIHSRIICHYKQNTIEWFIFYYGDIAGPKKYKEKCETTNFYPKLLEKYGEEYVKNFKKNQGRNLEYYINRLGEEAGKQRWDEYCKKRHDTYKSRSGTYAKKNMEYYINLFGEEEGIARRLAANEKISHKNSKEYLQTIYDEETVDELIFYRKSRSLEAYIMKHGEEEGTRLYDVKLANIRRRYTLEYLIETHGEEEGVRIYNGRKHSLNKYTGERSASSKIAMQLFEPICRHLPDIENAYYQKTGTNMRTEWKFPLSFAENEEYRLKQSLMYVDFKYHNKIIEFFGNYWHRSTKIYNNIDKPVDDKCLSIWEEDENRLKFIKDNGYDVLVVWEHEFRKNQKHIITKCLNFLGVAK